MPGIRFFSCSAVILLLVSALCPFAAAQLGGDAIVVVEQFEELYSIDPTNGVANDLLNSPPLDALFGHHLAIVDGSTGYVASFDDLFKFNFATGQLSSIAKLPFTPLELTADENGQLVALDPNHVYRVNPTTGVETSLHTETFFAPNDAVVDPSGSIYLTEFYDALGVIHPGSGFQQIGNFQTNMFQHVDLGPDGQLYLSTTAGESFYRVNPSTGAGVELDSAVFTFIDDLQVDAEGDIIFSGQVDSTIGVFRFDTTTTQVTTLVDGATVNDGFFNPLDIAIFSDGPVYDPADFNESGTVDGADLAIWTSGFGSDVSGDADGDGDTDGGDFIRWQRQVTRDNAAATRPVPEPAVATLLLGGLVFAHATMRWRTR